MRKPLLLLALLSSCKPVHVDPADDTGDGGLGDGGAGDGGLGDGGAGDGGLDGGGGDGGDGGGGDGGGGDGGEPTGTVTGFSLRLDEDVVTMVHADWDDPGASDAWVEYRFEGEAWLQAPLVDADSAVLLGIPSEMEVEARVVALVDGETWASEILRIDTGTLPDDLLLPTVDAWNESLAFEAEYLMVSVDQGDYTFQPPYMIQIFDRQGRMVWYKEVPDLMISFYPTVARDGTHIWFEGSDIFGLGIGSSFVQRQTLDGRWEESLEVPGLGQAVSEGPDGDFFYELRSGNSHGLMRLKPDGDTVQEWNCSAFMQELGVSTQQCDMNTCNWDPVENTVLTSMFYADTVFEVDLDTGEVIRQMGQLGRGDPYEFSPAESMFAYQHNPYWTEDRTILVSTHIVGRSGVQVAAEYEVDDETKTLTRIWSYTSKDLWATQLGEAVRLPNGNLLQGYGQDGAVREVTYEGETAWQVSWEPDRSGYRPIGHATLIPDLYALNRGPE